MQVFTALALFYAVQGAPIPLGELGEVEVPDEFEEETYRECLNEPRYLYEGHIHQVARKAIMADGGKKTQIVKCAALETNVQRLECISDRMLSKAYPSKEESDERIQLLESASKMKDKEYFRSHVAAYKRAENQRIKWQCKNLT